MLRAFGLVMYKLYYTNRAKKDAELIKAFNLKSKAEELLSLLDAHTLKNSKDNA